MSLHSSIEQSFTSLNDEQRRIVSSMDGPLLVIAGPGSGKTFSLVLRTLNLLVLEKATPSEIVLCTFTEKAAHELKDRIASGAAKIGYGGDLSDLRIGTIHGICHGLLNQFRHRTRLGSGFQILDELTQQLFLFEQFDRVFGPPENDLFLGKWKTKWTAIDGAISFFNKITEERIAPESLVAASNPFVSNLGRAYQRYREVQFEQNRIDFAVIQALALDIIEDPEIGPRVCSKIRYVMVDEYQDTNFIQEQFLLKISADTKNICVVGDEDQSLYRFRGATVRNILEFPDRMPGCDRVPLTTNYRSHKGIIRSYDDWMAAADWTDDTGAVRFRFEKSIRPHRPESHAEYPAVFSIWTKTQRDEAERFAALVQFLMERGIIEDYSQVALLLHSVQSQHSGPYIDALRRLGIPAFCPRARAFFESDEIQWMMASLALVFGWHGENRGPIQGPALTAFAKYIDDALVALAQRTGPNAPIAAKIREWVSQINGLQPGQSSDIRIPDIFYSLLALEPFKSALSDENRARTLAIVSQLLNSFQTYYRYTVITHKNREWVRRHLFNSFFRLLHESGLNDYEDPDLPLPKGHVQILTIHQSKGLEFPVVVVGSLDVNTKTAKQVDQILSPFYRRPPLEPTDRITAFDRMRLHYVAFSRAAKLLVLTCSGQPKDHFREIWDGLPQWPHVQRDLLEAQRFDLAERHPVKKRYSFTGDLRVYETCPRQYEYYRHYDFTPSRSSVIFFGLLVHQTIEEIHRLVLDGAFDSLNDQAVTDLFEKTFQFLCLSDVRPIGPAAKENALEQVLAYFRQNREHLRRVRETEVDVSLEKDDYILTGKVDLLMGEDGRLELLDFKTAEKPDPGDPILDVYAKQLCTYAHILEDRYGKRPERLYLYWTAEKNRKDALMEFPYEPGQVHAAARDFDEVVAKIAERDFRVVRVPARKVCKECDLRAICAADGIIQSFPA